MRELGQHTMKGGLERPVRACRYLNGNEMGLDYSQMETDLSRLILAR